MAQSPKDIQRLFNEPVGFRLCLLFIACMAYGMTLLWLPLEHYDQIITHSDHPKFYWFTLKQTQWLLSHGSPFGNATLIHNGMPGFLFLRTAFIFYLPFYLIFGAKVGYSIMLVATYLMFSLGIFCLLDRLLHIRIFAFIFALFTSLGLGLTDYISVGMTPYLMAMAANVWILYFLAQFYDGETRAIYMASLLAAALVYTHIASLVGILCPTGIFFLWHIKNEADRNTLLKHLGVAAFICALLSAPWFINYIELGDYINSDYLFTSDQETTLSRMIQIHAIQVMGYTGPVPQSLTHSFLLWFMFAFQGPTFYLIILPLLILSGLSFYNKQTNTLLPLSTFFFLGLFTWFSLAFGFVPALRILLQRVVSWLPLVSGLLYLCCLFIACEKAGPRFRHSLLMLGATGMVLGLLVIRPPLIQSFSSVNVVSEIDPALKQWVKPHDNLLLENCAHVNPSKDFGAFEYCAEQGHWTGLLSEWLDVPVFAHAGDDPHPFIRYRDHYLNSGTFNGEIIKSHNTAALEARLKKAYITKACVISKTARRYFHLHPHWIPMGASQYYTCYAHQHLTKAPWQQRENDGFESVWYGTQETSTQGRLPLLYYPMWTVNDSQMSGDVLSCDDYLCSPKTQTVTLNWPRHLYQWNFIVLGLLFALFMIRRFWGENL